MNETFASRWIRCVPKVMDEGKCEHGPTRTEAIRAQDVDYGTCNSDSAWKLKLSAVSTCTLCDRWALVGRLSSAGGVCVESGIGAMAYHFQWAVL